MDIGENTFLKLRQQRDQARSECDQARIQRDVALRKLNKALEVIKEQRKLIEHDKNTNNINTTVWWNSY